MEKKDLVTTEHEEYCEAMPEVKKFRDACAGTEAVRRGGKTYLPQFPAERDDDWKFRNETATFLNVTKKTLDTLCGLVFANDIMFGEDVPTEIQGTETDAGLVENIDNKGTHFNVFARDLFEDSFDGCAGILVDAPAVKANDRGEQIKLGIRPYFVDYCAEDIINWDYQINPISKKKELSLLVLRECQTVAAGQFLREEKTQYRVLKLDNNIPKWELWEETTGTDGKKEYVLTQEGIFERQTSIPFAIVGELGDKPPLMDLVYKNIEHYQTYSDYKSIIHKTCVPMLWTAGLDGDGPNAIGGSAWWKLSETGKMGFAEVTGGSIEKSRQALEDIKGEMSLLGLQMLMSNKPNGDVTATEKLLDSVQETSALQVQAMQLKDALELALGFLAKYLKQEDGGSITLGASWAQMTLSNEELKTWSQLVELGQMSLETFVELRHAAGQFPDSVTVQKELGRISKEAQDQEDRLTTITPVVNASQMPNGKQVVKQVDGTTAPPQDKGVANANNG
jgi:hypothetical protein